MLVNQVFPTDADSDGEDDEIGKPLPPLPDMQDAIAEQREHEAAQDDDDDADSHAHVTWIDGGDGLPAHDGGDDRETRHRRGI